LSIRLPRRGNILTNQGNRVPEYQCHDVVGTSSSGGGGMQDRVARVHARPEDGDEAPPASAGGQQLTGGTTGASLRGNRPPGLGTKPWDIQVTV